VHSTPPFLPPYLSPQRKPPVEVHILPLKTKISFEGTVPRRAVCTYNVYLLTKVGEGRNQRTFWNRAGVAFGHNRDGSLNFKLDLFPSLTFQIRQKKSDADEPPAHNTDTHEEASNGHR
jgi:hypothetical protein